MYRNRTRNINVVHGWFPFRVPASFQYYFVKIYAVGVYINVDKAAEAAGGLNVRPVWVLLGGWG